MDTKLEKFMYLYNFLPYSIPDKVILLLDIKNKFYEGTKVNSFFE